MVQERRCCQNARCSRRAHFSITFFCFRRTCCRTVRRLSLLIFFSYYNATTYYTMASRTFVRALSSTASKNAAQKPPHLLSLADLTVPEIGTLLESAHRLKKNYHDNRVPLQAGQFGHSKDVELLKGRSVAILMSKRSTRTRVASESATALLGTNHIILSEHDHNADTSQTGGHAMFLGSQDIQLGVNESLHDSAKVISSMVDGIMARVGHHSEVEVRSIETMSMYSS